MLEASHAYPFVPSDQVHFTCIKVKFLTNSQSNQYSDFRSQQDHSLSFMLTTSTPTPSSTSLHNPTLWNTVYERPTRQLQSTSPPITKGRNKNPFPPHEEVVLFKPILTPFWVLLIDTYPFVWKSGIWFLTNPQSSLHSIIAVLSACVVNSQVYIANGCLLRNL